MLPTAPGRAAQQRGEIGAALLGEVEIDPRRVRQLLERVYVGQHQPFLQVVTGRPYGGDVERLLGTEVVVDQGAGGVGDVVDGELVGRSGAEQPQRGADDLVPPLHHRQPAPTSRSSDRTPLSLGGHLQLAHARKPIHFHRRRRFRRRTRRVASGMSETSESEVAEVSEAVAMTESAVSGEEPSMEERTALGQLILFHGGEWTEADYEALPDGVR